MKMIKQTFVRCFAALLIMVALFTLSIIAVHCIPKSVVAENLYSSTKVIEQEGLYREFFHFKLFQMDNFTDCYMFNLMASADADEPVRSAMLNDDYKSNDYMSLAYDTENVIKGDFKGLSKESYGRYWHGYQVTLKPLMTIMDYSAIRILNYILFSLLIVVCSWLIYRKIGKAACGLFVLSLALINFPIVPLSLQFSTCFYLSFLSMIAVMVFPRLVEKDDNLYCTFFIIGGITSFMDFLTTPQLTLGLPMIVCLLMSNRKDKWKYVIYISIAWALGYGLIWASKWLVGYLLTGTNILADAMESAKLRTSDVYKGMHMTIGGILAFIWQAVERKHLVLPFFGAIVVVVALILLYIKMIKSKKVFGENVFLLLVVMIVPIWFLVMRNHSIQHGWFTWRAGLLSLYSLLLLVYYTVDWNRFIKK
ncbi:hypothetical protein [Segatella hominis]|uniref:hypothetical protein n=1 Tax=Segatella hominis TaxID=2518605 RepID=UPI003F81026C